MSVIARTCSNATTRHGGRNFARRLDCSLSNGVRFSQNNIGPVSLLQERQSGGYGLAFTVT